MRPKALLLELAGDIVVCGGRMPPRSTGTMSSRANTTSPPLRQLLRSTAEHPPNQRRRRLGHRALRGPRHKLRAG